MNDLQKIEFELLKELLSVCEKLGLRYYLVCGSALGAVKYEGFIPWDDDVDVALPRPDYDILTKKAGELLPEHMFLQNYLTDPEYPLVSSKLRNLNTTFVEKNIEDLNIVHGVFIDVFPIDGLPDGEEEQRKYIKTLRSFERRRTANQPRKKQEGGRIGLRSLMIYYFNRLTGAYKDTPKVMERFSGFLRSFPPEKSKVWCIHHEERSLSAFNPAEWYGEGTEAKFEGMTVMIPEKYDLYLTKRYGDWRADLPDDQKVGHHYTTVEDLTRPYTDYIEKLENGKIRIKSKEEVDSISNGG